MREGIGDDSMSLVFEEDGASLMTAASDDSAVLGNRSVDFISNDRLQFWSLAQRQQQPAKGNGHGIARGNVERDNRHGSGVEVHF